MKILTLLLLAIALSPAAVIAHEFCSSCNRCHRCGKTRAELQQVRVQPKVAAPAQTAKAATPAQTLAATAAKTPARVTVQKPVVASEPLVVASAKQSSIVPPKSDAVVPKKTQVVEAELRHPPFSNQFNYPRRIDPQLQARAQREATLLAQYGYAENQRRWISSGGALGHPIGVPAGYVGGTGCSWPEQLSGSWQRTSANEITTCEPGGARYLLVAEAVAYNAKDRVWYASRIWQPF